eukprot:SM010078S09541  [mRNA]  locus=s10078:248:456:- [translate_table: standard]
MAWSCPRLAATISTVRQRSAASATQPSQRG